MLSDRVLALVGFALFIGVIAVVLIIVFEPALWIVVIIAASMAIYDLFMATRKPKDGEGEG